MVTIEEIDAFLIETGISPSAFGIALCNSNKLVKAFRCGREITQNMSDKIRDYMSEKRTGMTGVPRVSLPDESRMTLHADYVHERYMRRASQEYMAAVRREHPDIFPKKEASQ